MQTAPVQQGVDGVEALGDARGAGLGLLQLTGSGDAAYAGVTLVAALPYLGAAAVVAGFTR
ncbi:MAG TPA: hypothetical protein VFH51_19900, partial [Myxococcota bacterium]|nr:hypothetical protein [Myxococcota bacterium]